MGIEDFILANCKNKRSVFCDRYEVSKQSLSRWISLGYLINEIEGGELEIIKTVTVLRAAK
jgi:hypothetical protein